MKLVDIQALWDKDSVFDSMNIDSEALKTTELHSKYYKIFSQERLVHKKYESDLKILKKLKHDYYSGAIDEETLKERGWEPNRRMILKTDIPMHIEADDEVINLQAKVDYQKEKLLYLESIISTIGQRGYTVRAVIDWRRFISGN